MAGAKSFVGVINANVIATVTLSDFDLDPLAFRFRRNADHLCVAGSVFYGHGDTSRVYLRPFFRRVYEYY